MNRKKKNADKYYANIIRNRREKTKINYQSTE